MQRVLVSMMLILLGIGLEYHAYSEDAPASANASSTDNNQNNSTEWYFSWGYSRNYWAPTDIHVSQPSLGNDFTVHRVKAIDFPQWDTGIFNKGITTPQWNLRLGRFFGSERTYAIELNIDHSKYSTVENQTAHITGTIDNKSVDFDQELTADYFRYWLHNGANHIMLNLVHRTALLGELNQNYSLSGLLKAGFGIMLPHVSNTILGQNNDVGTKDFKHMVGIHSGWWQLKGWTVGVEAAARWIPIMPVYLEFSWKAAYSSLKGSPVYEGTADHSLFMNEIVASLGCTILSGP